MADVVSTSRSPIRRDSIVSGRKRKVQTPETVRATRSRGLEAALEQKPPEEQEEDEDEDAAEDAGLPMRNDQGDLYWFKSVLDLVSSQECKEFSRPLEECKGSSDLSAIRHSIGQGGYNALPTKLREDIRAVFQQCIGVAADCGVSPALRKKALR
eukprot:SAG11_NODE_1904_length_4088_cov_3.427676_10_plen_155_part_00